MINVIITSYNEPEATTKAVQAFLTQDYSEEINIIVVDPFPEIEKFIKTRFKKNKNVSFFLDPGEGKSYALNILFSNLFKQDKNDIIILTDGDVYVSKNAVSEIIKAFQDKQVGVVTGKPVSINSRNNMFGYWSHLVFEGIHKIRKSKSAKEEYFESTGYLFAIRQGVISEFPIDVSEDAIIPYLFLKKGYRNTYAEKAEVYVKNPENMKDWYNQKTRNIKGHENLNKYLNKNLRTKSFKNEIKYGSLFALSYPRTLTEFLWTLRLFLARLKLYLLAFKQIKSKSYQDGWRD